MDSILFLKTACVLLGITAVGGLAIDTLLGRHLPLEQAVGEIRGFCRDCGERLKMIVWGVEEVL